MTDPRHKIKSPNIFGGDGRGPTDRLGVAVVHDLVTAIVTGEIAEGAMLPIEAELTTHFGVSRTVIRESIKRVEEKGLVVVLQGSGTSVRPRDSWNVLDPVVLQVMLEHDDSLGILDDLAVVRGALEGAMASSAARIRTEAELTQIDEAFDRMGETIDDEQSFADADVLFHLAVMSASKISLAESINRTLYSRARESARFTRNNTREAFEATLVEHRLILEAIRSRQDHEAEMAMRDHIMEAWRRRRPPTSRRS